MKKIILASLLAISVSAFAQSEMTPNEPISNPISDPIPSQDTIQSSNNKVTLPAKKHKARSAKKNKKNKKSHTKKHKNK